MSIAIVCGDHRYEDRERVNKVLDAAVERLGVHTVIVGRRGTTDLTTGKAIRGADLLAEEWAMARPDISVIAVPGDWEGLGKRAGPVRNKLMLSILHGGDDPDRYVLAFEGGDCTGHMVDIAGRDPAIKVKRV